jgi:hypothetical protein
MCHFPKVSDDDRVLSWKRAGTAPPDLRTATRRCTSSSGPLRVFLVCAALQLGVFAGVPMRPDEIQGLMNQLNQPKLAHAMPADRTTAMMRRMRYDIQAPWGLGWRSIQEVPNLSLSIAKRDAKNVSCIGMKI